MRKDLVPANEAVQMIMHEARPLQSEMVELHNANGRVLAQDHAALRTQPPFDASAMDGYGVHQSDLSSLPTSLKVIGQSAAGHPFSGKVGAGEAVRIFTGASVPRDVGTIIIQENTTSHDDKVEILTGNKPGKFIRKSGLDFTQGDILLNAGRMLDPQAISLAASMNHARLKVWQKPVVAIIATGDELVHPGGNLAQGQIISSNSFALGAICREAGASVIDMGIAADTVEALVETTQQAINQGAELIVTMGGASVGDHDLVLPAMRQQGFQFEFSKIAMRPGKPFLFAKNKMSDKTVRLLGLAGNPVSSIVAGQVFVRPLINALAGRPPQLVTPKSAVLGTDMPANDKRREYMRAELKTNQQGEQVVIPFSSQDSSQLANLVRADCLIIREINAPAIKAGERCEVVHLR